MRRPTLALLLAGLLAAGCRQAETARPQLDPELAAFIPADTQSLASIRMEELRATPLYRKLVAQRRLSELDEFAAKTGFDPRQDVRELLVASGDKDAVVIARGRFRVQVPPEFAKSEYKGYTIYTKEQGAFAIINPATALAGSTARVRAAIDQYKTGRRAGEELLAKARSLSGPSQVWFVAKQAPSTLPPGGNAANFSRILRSIQDIAVTADLRAGLHAIATGEARTDQDAKALADAARGLVGMGRLSVPDNRPELLRLYDGIHIDQQQRTLKLTADIPQDLLEKMLDMLPSVRPARPGARL